VPVRFIEALRGDQGLIGGDLGEALSFAYLNQFVGVSNQSYGIPSANNLGPEGPLAKAALQQAATTGRGGKGTVFVVSNGNGRTPLDNGNYAELQNSRYVISVAAMQHTGKFASYSSPGSNLMITAPAGEFPPTDGVIGTDLTGDFGLNEELVPAINNK